MSDLHDDRGGGPTATIGSASPKNRPAHPCTATDIALTRAAEMLLGIRGTRAYADATPEERLELESYVLELVDGRPPNGAARAHFSPP
ncbi:hypothetical protein UAJ10_25520 [Nitrospirillum sp. BR 11164]|uniref:hypothetical protein n=1 Tax=Nitrospirillum sp. BR 11164 TaxID=3104324 RepID=UPI002AFF4877|nr:hypothetical protein [Nitrospirillum sp. BR 11164]MEA1652356.1 hypothetical protein [Nitrospirillum sp. BR 11164]